MDLLDKITVLFGEEQHQTIREFSFKEKRQLLANIVSLPEKHQSGLYKIIEYGHPEMDFSDRLRVDLNTINDETIFKIYKYINRCKRLENQSKKKIKKLRKTSGEQLT